MLFITAGMGGGTGTGAAPVIADIAKSMGILTVAVVTRPFKLEGASGRRSRRPASTSSAKRVDSLIIIPNDKLMEVLGDDISMLDAYAAANDVLHGAVSGIAEVINNPGLVNVDFADVRTVMGEVGMAMMGSATAAGADRARQAAEQAVRSPLLEDVNLAGARGVLVNVTASSGLRMKEYQEVMNTIKEFTADDAMVIVGTVIDDAMDDRLRVTMIATGLGGAQSARREQQAPNMTLVEQPQVVARTGTDGVGVTVDNIDYENLDAAGGDPEARTRRSGAVGVRCDRDPGVPAQAGGLNRAQRIGVGHAEQGPGAAAIRRRDPVC